MEEGGSPEGVEEEGKTLKYAGEMGRGREGRNIYYSLILSSPCFHSTRVPRLHLEGPASKFSDQRHSQGEVWSNSDSHTPSSCSLGLG